MSSSPIDVHIIQAIESCKPLTMPAKWQDTVITESDCDEELLVIICLLIDKYVSDTFPSVSMQHLKISNILPITYTFTGTLI